MASLATCESVSAATCALCDLPIGRQVLSRVFDGREISFCCMGCINVYSILRESGVIASGQNLRDTEIFRRSLELGLVSNPEEDVAAQLARDPAVDANLPT